METAERPPCGRRHGDAAVNVMHLKDLVELNHVQRLSDDPVNVHVS